jgi:hypothetical protein
MKSYRLHRRICIILKVPKFSPYLDHFDNFFSNGEISLNLAALSNQ